MASDIYYTVRDIHKVERKIPVNEILDDMNQIGGRYLHRKENSISVIYDKKFEDITYVFSNDDIRHLYEKMLEVENYTINYSGRELPSINNSFIFVLTNNNINIKDFINKIETYFNNHSSDQLIKFYSNSGLHTSTVRYVNDLTYIYNSSEEPPKNAYRCLLKYNSQNSPKIFEKLLNKVKVWQFMYISDYLSRLPTDEGPRTLLFDNKSLNLSLITKLNSEILLKTISNSIKIDTQLTCCTRDSKLLNSFNLRFAQSGTFKMYLNNNIRKEEEIIKIYPEYNIIKNDKKESNIPKCNRCGIFIFGDIRLAKTANDVHLPFCILCNTNHKNTPTFDSPITISDYLNMQLSIKSEQYYALAELHKHINCVIDYFKAEKSSSTLFITENYIFTTDYKNLLGNIHKIQNRKICGINIIEPRYGATYCFKSFM